MPFSFYFEHIPNIVELEIPQHTLWMNIIKHGKWVRGARQHGNFWNIFSHRSVIKYPWDCDKASCTQKHSAKLYYERESELVKRYEGRTQSSKFNLCIYIIDEIIDSCLMNRVKYVCERRAKRNCVKMAILICWMCTRALSVIRCVCCVLVQLENSSWAQLLWNCEIYYHLVTIISYQNLSRVSCVNLLRKQRFFSYFKLTFISLIFSTYRIMWKQFSWFRYDRTSTEIYESRSFV